MQQTDLTVQKTGLSGHVGTPGISIVRPVSFLDVSKYMLSFCLVPRKEFTLGLCSQEYSIIHISEILQTVLFKGCS